MHHMPQTIITSCPVKPVPAICIHQNPTISGWKQEQIVLPIIPLRTITMQQVGTIPPQRIISQPCCRTKEYRGKPTKRVCPLAVPLPLLATMRPNTIPLSSLPMCLAILLHPQVPTVPRMLFHLPSWQLMCKTILFLPTPLSRQTSVMICTTTPALDLTILFTKEIHGFQTICRPF